jgi:hypothetical protein
MEVIPLRADPAAGAEVNGVIEPLQVSALRVGVGFFLLDQVGESLGQQVRDRGLTLHSDPLDLKQNVFG